jgi:hypothetical protein
MSSLPAVNPNNPYVRDEFYFVGKSGNYVYEESQLYIVRLVLQILLLVFGIPLCCFVFFLILKRSPTRFLPYKKMFLLTAAVDAFILVQFLFVQPVRFSLYSKEKFFFEGNKLVYYYNEFAKFCLVFKGKISAVRTSKIFTYFVHS